MDSHRHDEALQYYSAALSVHPTNTPGYFILQSKLFIAQGLWKDALIEAKKVSIIVSCKSPHVNEELSGNCTRRDLTMGLQGGTCGFGRTL